MRTCPACGEDTEAGYAEGCTECGFSPTGEQPPEPEPIAAVPEPEVTIGDQPAAPDQPPPGSPPLSEPPAGTGPGPEAAAKKKRPAVRGLVWLAVIGAAIGADRLGVFDQPPGPTSDQVEQAIADDARQYGAAVAVDCPSDTDQTDVDQSFNCMVTSASGATVTIEVTNREDTFEWQSGPLTTLR